MANASLEDWFHINALFVRYATALDRGDVDGVVACFADDGWLESPILGKFVGPSGIREFARRTAQLKTQHGAQFRHVVSNLSVEVDGERANATCYLLDFLTRDGKTALLSPGDYECGLRKVSGDWRFEHRRVTLDRTFVVAGM